MRLSQQQAKAIVAAQLNADSPITKIRSKIGLKEHTIRYALDRAKSNGIIERRYFINLFKLGLLQHEVFFSLSSEERGSREALLMQLKNSESVSWIGRLGGDYQFGINICSRDLSQTISFFDQLSATHGRSILERTLSLRVSLTYFGNRYLAPQLKQLKPLSYRNTAGTVEIDPTDHRILAAITANAELSGHQLARALEIPQSTLDYRLKRLRNDGVIVASYYAFNGAPLGVLSFMCLIVTRGMSATLRDRVYDFCLKNPEVVLMIESIGSWDFEFVIDAFSAQEAMRTSERIGDHFGREIQSLKMIPIFSYPKVHEYPFSNYSA
jgi:DNA-binding Lrp family transcriptional regulator